MKRTGSLIALVALAAFALPDAFIETAEASTARSRRSGSTRTRSTGTVRRSSSSTSRNSRSKERTVRITTSPGHTRTVRTGGSSSSGRTIRTTTSPRRTRTVRTSGSPNSGRTIRTTTSPGYTRTVRTSGSSSSGRTIRTTTSPGYTRTVRTSGSSRSGRTIRTTTSPGHTRTVRTSGSSRFTRTPAADRLPTATHIVRSPGSTTRPSPRTTRSGGWHPNDGYGRRHARADGHDGKTWWLADRSSNHSGQRACLAPEGYTATSLRVSGRHGRRDDGHGHHHWHGGKDGHCGHPTGLIWIGGHWWDPDDYDDLYGVTYYPPVTQTVYVETAPPPTTVRRRFVTRQEVLDAVSTEELALSGVEYQRVQVLIARSILLDLLAEGDVNNAHSYELDVVRSTLTLTAPTETIAVIRTMVRDQRTFEAVTQPNRYGHSAAVLVVASPFFLKNDFRNGVALAAANFKAVRDMLTGRDPRYARLGKQCWLNAEFGTVTIVDDRDAIVAADELTGGLPFVPSEMVAAGPVAR